MVRTIKQVGMHILGGCLVLPFGLINQFVYLIFCLAIFEKT